MLIQKRRFWINFGHFNALIVSVQRYWPLAVNETQELITNQYENQPMLSVEIILSIHSVGSLDLNLFINWVKTSPGDMSLFCSAGEH